MFYTILESGDKTNLIGDKFKKSDYQQRVSCLSIFEQVGSIGYLCKCQLWSDMTGAVDTWVGILGIVCLVLVWLGIVVGMVVCGLLGMPTS
jgi:hypothetical protein